MNSEYEDLRELFIEEVTESLAELETGLLQLEKTPDDPDAVDLLFRIAHSVKGSSSMMHFTEMARFAHILESLLDQIRRGARPATPPVVDALLASGDVLHRMVRRIAAQQGATAPPDEDAERVRAVIAGFLADTGTPTSAAASAGAPPAIPRLLRINFRPSFDVLQRGLDPLRILAELAELGDMRAAVPDLSGLPPLADMDAERCYLAWTVTLLTSRSSEDIDQLLSFAAGADGLHVTPLTRPATAAEPDELPRRRASDRDEATVIRVAVDKIDRLVNLVGELVTTQSMLARETADPSADGTARLREAVAHMERHVRELHHGILAVRMVSVRTLFARLPRVVRDLAAAMDKQVRVELSGEETELDKTIIEKIADPLLHLVRNAVDHGLESPAERRAAGKPEVGRIRLDAYQRGGNVYIDVDDDGRGLDRERILAKARRQGLVRTDEVLTDDDTFALIFRPGFSTAETVTDISGRGVGMDVVRQNVASLGGTIAISTEAGRGTRFRVKLPLTLALLEGQILTVGDQAYVLPLAAIAESLKPAPGSVHVVDRTAEAVLVRRTAIPLLRLHRLFDLVPTSTDPYAGLIVIVEHEERRIALLVDRLLGQQQVVIKSLETHFQKVGGVGGATILGDGRVALILDVPGLLDLARFSPRRDAPMAMSLG